MREQITLLGDQLILSCLAKDPSARPQDARELSGRLTEITDTSSGVKRVRGSGGSAIAPQAGLDGATLEGLGPLAQSVRAAGS
jgi:hypothetical protein